MKVRFQKVKMVHHILSDFYPFLMDIEQNPDIKRIVPGRISRKQKGSSDLRFSVSYTTLSGIKGIMAKGATAQEIFFLCSTEKQIEVIEFLLSSWEKLYL